MPKRARILAGMVIAPRSLMVIRLNILTVYRKYGNTVNQIRRHAIEITLVVPDLTGTPQRIRYLYGVVLFLERDSYFASVEQ